MCPVLLQSSCQRSVGAHWHKLCDSAADLTPFVSPMHILHLALQGCLKTPPISYGCTPDTGGHIKYLLDEIAALNFRPEVDHQTIVTRKFSSKEFPNEYLDDEEAIDAKTTLRRIEGRSLQYLHKEELYTEHDELTRNLVSLIKSLPRRPDIIHAHYADAGSIAARIKQQLGIPFVFSAHSLGRVKLAIGGEPSPKGRSFLKRVEAEEISLRSADRVIASSRNEIESQLSLYKGFDPAWGQVMPAGSTLKKGKEKDSSHLFQKMNIFLHDLTKPVILALARPVRRKNLQALVHAYGKSPTLQKKANLVIFAGVREGVSHMEGEQGEVVRELVELVDDYDLYGKCALPKRHKEDDVVNIYELAGNSGGVFVNPATHEPFGLTVIEAAACGVPCVATCHGGPAEIIENYGHGVSVDPDDHHALSQKILELIENKERWQKFSEAGMKAAQTLGWPRFAADFVEMASGLCKKQTFSPVEIKNRKLICCDIDNTLTGSREGLEKLTAWLASQPQYLFVISTGRRIDEAVRILKEWKVPLPDYLVTSVGTEIYEVGSSYSELQLDRGWKATLESGWSFLVLRNVLAGVRGLVLQDDINQRPLKLGYLVPKNQKQVLEAVERALRDSPISANVIFSHDTYLDVIPSAASKGHALEHLCDKLRIPTCDAVAAGDSGNDIEMLEMAGKGIVVGNMTSELAHLKGAPNITVSSKNYADGVLDGLKRLGLG